MLDTCTPILQLNHELTQSLTQIMTIRFYRTTRITLCKKCEIRRECMDFVTDFSHFDLWILGSLGIRNYINFTKAVVADSTSHNTISMVMLCFERLYSCHFFLSVRLNLVWFTTVKLLIDSNSTLKSYGSCTLHYAL